ncbi:NAD(P)H-dependent flavin oxidoreductase [Paracoccus jiaweipingae]|uniref:NAD(P)H-dependent flavin oxidoreductase n=1 Tax=unclassified Paracoccus (in: a-proteobacteria) TaxID=2688777 RepID=UPI0037A9DDD2
MTPFPQTALTRRIPLAAPVLAGGLMWLADAGYVAACARAGILGFITAASFPDPDDLRDQIRRCRAEADGRPFGVNVSMLPKLVPGEKTADVFRLIVDEGVDYIETSGRSPEEYMPIIRQGNALLIHKVPAVRYAVSAQRAGVDMVSIVGAECGGHPGMDMTGTMVNAAMAARALDIPFLIGGGIATGDQIIAALAMGAAGVVIGTRFLVADEIPAHPAFKQRIAQANERDTVLTMQSVRNTVRTLRNATTDAVARLEREKPDVTIADLLPLVSGQIARQGYRSGDVEQGLYAAGQALALTHSPQPLAAIVKGLIAEAAQARARICG